MLNATPMLQFLIDTVNIRIEHRKFMTIYRLVFFSYSSMLFDKFNRPSLFC